MPEKKQTFYFGRGDNCPKCQGGMFVIEEESALVRTQYGMASFDLWRCMGCKALVGRHVKEPKKEVENLEKKVSGK